MKAILPSSLLLAGLLLSVSCTGPEGASGADGKEGAAGVPGASCWATPVDDGFLMVCGADTVGVLKNGADGAKGSDGAKGDKGDKGSKGDKGADGASCTSVSIEVNGVHGVEITCGTAKDTVMNGAQGAQGENGEQGDKGDKGDDGAAGTTCTASEITDGTADGYWLYCDCNLVGVLRNGAYGQDGADGADGQDGQNGADGQNGQDGASCHVEALPNDAGYSLYCGDEYIGDILNGRDGQDGQDGADGASCTLASIDVNGVHGVEITCGAQKDTVMNGAQGIQGVKGDAGADGADGVDGASCSGVSLGDTAVVISCGGVVVDTLFNGKNGADGAQGEQGIQGVKGDDGSSCTGRAIDGVGIEITCGGAVVDTLRNGRETTLHATIDRLHPRRTLLFFSNPGCPNCKEITEALADDPEISAQIADGSLLVVNVYPDEDLEAWYDYLPNYPDAWVCGYDPAQNLHSDTLYWVRAIPSLYLLDEEKRVVRKDAPLEVILIDGKQR